MGHARIDSNDGKYAVVAFDSFDAFARSAWEDPCANAEHADRVAHYVTTGSPGGFHFAGYSGGWRDCARYLQTGWPEGVDRMREVLGRIAVPAVQSVRRRGVWAEQGDELNRDRLWAGNYDSAWRTTTRVAAARPTRVRFVTDVGASCRVPKDDLFWAGAATAGLAEALTAAGYTVEVWGAYTNSARNLDLTNKTGFVGGVRVKAFHDPLNLSALCAMLAHPAAFRLGMFAQMTRTCKGKNLSDGLGTTGHLTDNDSAALARLGLDDAGTTTILVPQMRNAEETQAFVSLTLHRIQTGKNGAAA